MVKGILADHDVRGQFDFLVAQARAEPWSEFWNELRLILLHFEDVGLLNTASDYDIWHLGQKEQLVLVTGNRNLDAPDSLEATIRQWGTPDSLPVFTIADLERLNRSRSYTQQIVVTMLSYLLRIEELRGTGRLWLP